MPKDDGQRSNNNSVKFFNHCISKMRGPKSPSSVVDQCLLGLVHHNSVSFREIERLVALRNLAESAGLISYHDLPLSHDLALVVFYIWCSIMKPYLLDRLLGGREDVTKILKESDLVQYTQSEPLGYDRTIDIWCVIKTVSVDQGGAELRKEIYKEIDDAVAANTESAAQRKFRSLGEAPTNRLDYISAVMSNLRQ